MFSLVTISSKKIHSIDEFEFVQNYPKDSFDLNDPSNSPIESVLYYCSGIINESRNYSFCINLGGGNISLPIKPEMSILLEQIAKIMSFLRSNYTNSLIVDFFEQGYEIIITLEKLEKSVDVHLTGKDPEIILTEIIPIDLFVSSICRFVLDFISAVSIIDLSILHEPAFVKWFSQVSIRE